LTGVRIEVAGDASQELVEAVARLVPQLSTTAPKVGRAELEEIVASPATTLLVARDGADVVGILTLVMFRITTGLRARIEDVVVDREARGRGAGEALTLEAIRRATAAGARTIELTSHSTREAATRLYRRLGFEVYDTTVYRR
jgi:ribosomal protein S18 acetylase RimI-like enzyme